MEITIIYPDQYQRESLKVAKKLAEGKFSVYQVYSASSNQTYALKIFPKDGFGTTQYQKEQRMLKLSHENIIKSTPIMCQNADYFAIMTDFAVYGNFLSLLLDGLLDNETLIRTYFHQLIEGIEYMHSQRVAHLDLKLENIMLGGDFKLKIIDFDQAQSITNQRMTSSGTPDFRAPEVLEGTCRNLGSIDIYSAGIILYTLIAKEYPFKETEVEGEVFLKDYAEFVNDNKAFWKGKASRKQNENFFSAEFIELINGMLHVNPEKRFTIKDIKKSKWYNGSVLSMESLKAEMKTKCQ